MLFANEQLGSFNAARGGAPGYLDDTQKLRWERLQCLRAVFESRHAEYFLLGGRTQFDYPEEEINGEVKRRYITVNLCRLLSLKTADLMFSAKAKIDAPTPGQSAWLNDLARRSLIHSRFHGAAVASSWSGAGFLASCLHRGEAHLLSIEPDEMFPVGAISPNGQYERYVRVSRANVGTERNPIWLLLEATYAIGSIERRCYQLQGDTRKAEVSLDQWPWFRKDPPPPIQATGLDANTITYLPNTVDGRLEISDYDGLHELQDTVNAKFAQIARVIAKHANPKLAAPNNAAGSDGNLRGKSEVYFFNDKNEIPQYIVWSAELDAAAQDRDAALNAFCMVSELSQILLGLKQGATPDAARKVRLECTNTLAKIARKVLIAEPVIAHAVETTMRLDQTSALRRSYPVGSIGVHLRDGLPVDNTELATEASTWRAARLLSTEAGVEMRVEDPDAVKIELARLAQEAAAATPTVFAPFNGETAEERSENEAAETAEAA